VIGSQKPWIETILLNRGAKNITTFDYVKITSDHPQVSTLQDGPRLFKELLISLALSPES
jgi:hypothetical protein